MPKRKTKKTTIMLFEGQYADLQSVYKNAGGAAKALRRLIDLHLEEVQPPALTGKDLESLNDE